MEKLKKNCLVRLMTRILTNFGMIDMHLDMHGLLELTQFGIFKPLSISTNLNKNINI